MTETTYYQRNSDAILNRAKDYYKNDKKEINAETYLKTEKIKIENMEEIDIIICHKKKTKN